MGLGSGAWGLGFFVGAFVDWRFGVWELRKLLPKPPAITLTLLQFSCVAGYPAARFRLDVALRVRLRLFYWHPKP